jgi:hypothetical protein
MESSYDYNCIPSFSLLSLPLYFLLYCGWVGLEIGNGTGSPVLQKQDQNPIMADKNNADPVGQDVDIYSFAERYSHAKKPKELSELYFARYSFPKDPS